MDCGVSDLVQTDPKAQDRAGAKPMRNEYHAPADAAKAKAMAVVAGTANDALVQQLLDNNARLKSELKRMEIKCATAEGIAMGKAPYVDDLNERLRASEERNAHERKRHREEVEQLKHAHKTAADEAAEQIASLTEANDQLRRGGRTKAPGEGRGPGLAKISEEPMFKTFKPDDLEECDFLMHWQITSPAMLHLKLGDYDIRRLKAYWPEDKQSTKRQSKQRAECFWNLLGLRTGKWPVGDADAMFKYMMGPQDVGTGPGQFHSRKHQVATWLWPSRVTDYASLKANTAAAKFMDRRANLYMTGVRGVYALYEIYKGVRTMPPGHVEGVDPIPQRGPKRQNQKRKAEAPPPPAEEGRGLAEDIYVDGCDEAGTSDDDGL